MRCEQGDILYDLQRRMDDMEDEMRRWRFDISDD
jgi:tryptophan 2,3-dioxygenase